MQRFVEDVFTVTIGAISVLFICAAVHYLIAGNFGYMVAGAIGAAVSSRFVQLRTPFNVGITLEVPRDAYDDYSDVELYDGEDCASPSIYPFSEN